jgi:DNA repair protein RadD
MLNQNLRISELQGSLKKYIDVIDLIQDDILGEQKIPLVNDKKRLGMIHHALNVENYKKIEFRQRLLEHSEDEQIISFLKKLKIYSEEFKKNPKKRYNLIKKAAAKKWGNNEETKIFVSHFGYDESLLPKEILARKDQVVIKNAKNPMNVLWSYQSKIFYEAIEETEITTNRFIISMPTGAGKTKTAMQIVTDFLNNIKNKNENRQVLWIADKEELCDQAVDAFEEIWPHIGKFPIKLYKFFGDSKSEEFEKNSIIIATYGKLRGISKKKIINPDLIVCDEAHNAIAPTYRETIENISEYKTRVIGLTATPVRSNDSETEELIEFFYGHEPISIDFEDEENAIEYLQKREFLSRYNAHTIDSEVKFSVSRDLLKLIEKDRDLPKKFLQEIASNETRNLVIAKLLYKLGKDGIKVLYFAPTKEQSKLICALMISFGFNASHVDGETPTDYRKGVIKKFKAGETKILCNFGIFTTGFDDPKIDAVVIGRPTTSLVLHTQMIGRGMRGPKMGGTESFDLYRINDELPGIVLADSSFKEIWEYGN